MKGPGGNMKRAILLIMMCFSSLLAQDQIRSGVYSLQGGISYYSEKLNTGTYSYRVTQLGFGPGVGYFVADGLELSGSISWTEAKITYLQVPSYAFAQGGEDHTAAYMIGLRYYAAMNHVAPFVGAKAGESWYSSGHYSSPNTAYMFEVGFEYFIGKPISIEPVVQYSATSLQSQSTNTTMVGFGVKYFVY
jgi:hypothetical protein